MVKVDEEEVVEKGDGLDEELGDGEVDGVGEGVGEGVVKAMVISLGVCWSEDTWL